MGREGRRGGPSHSPGRGKGRWLGVVPLSWLPLNPLTFLSYFMLSFVFANFLVTIPVAWRVFQTSPSGGAGSKPVAAPR